MLLLQGRAACQLVLLLDGDEVELRTLAGRLETISLQQPGCLGYLSRSLFLLASSCLCGSFCTWP